ncbi:MAG TPA: hypothetical protein VII94_04710 [Candidatus Saccharimonadales bacterium]
MKKFNAIVYDKLFLQAEEAKEQGMVKLAAGLLNTLGSFPEDENVIYNIENLQEDVYKQLWNVAASVIKYHDLNSVDAEKVHNTLEVFASKIIAEVEQSLGVDNSQIGPLESNVPGESK